MKRLALTALFCLAAAAVSVHADEMRPGLLQITETEPGWFDVTWKVPLIADRTLAISPALPAFMQAVAPPARYTLSGAAIETSRYHSEGQPINGSTIAINGLSTQSLDILLQISLLDGSTHSAVLQPQAPAFTVPAKASRLQVAGAYWQMGTIHILEGIDHLLFVLALMLIVSGNIALLKAITAFTVAHSITLALASLNLLHLPSAPTEAIISLSIVFLAVEIIHKRRGVVGLTERLPWIIAFIFGLFHGLGFAGALAEIGLPQHEVPLALFMFNVGVESGQLLFVGVVLSLLWLLRRFVGKRVQSASAFTAPYMIGGVAAFWTIERLMNAIALTA